MVGCGRVRLGMAGTARHGAGRSGGMRCGMVRSGMAGVVGYGWVRQGEVWQVWWGRVR